MWKFLIVSVAVLTLAVGEKFSRQNAPEVERLPRARTKVRFPRTQVLDDLFDVYDSTFLAHLWPKLRNGVHVSVAPACWEDMASFYKHLLEGSLWAYIAADASGRYQPGVFEGNRHWVGSKHECLSLNERYADQHKNETAGAKSEDFPSVTRKEKYFDGSPEGEWQGLAQRRVSTLASPPPSPPPPPPARAQLATVGAARAPFLLAFHSAAIVLNVTKAALDKSYDITLGLCVPQSCAPEDTRAILDFSVMVSDHLRANRTGPRTALVTRVRLVQDTYDFRQDTAALALVVFTVSVLCLALIATAVDLGLIKVRAGNFCSTSFDLQKANVDTKKDEKSNNTIEIHKKRPYQVPKVVLPKKELNTLSVETLALNNASQLNLAVKKTLKADARPPSITLDVVAVDETRHASCARCGKYRRQCAGARTADAACPRMSYNSFNFSSEDRSSCKKKAFLKSVLLCFSLRHSWGKLCNTNLTSRDLSAVHALKVFSTFWIVFVHVALVACYLSANGGDINEYNSMYYILSTGTLAFDTLIFASGVLSAHHMFFLRRRYSLRELVGCGGGCGRVLQAVCFISNRAVRLVPPYAVAVFLAGAVARAADRTAPVAVPGYDVTCDRYWWRNLLYVSNLYPADEQCMQVSWYLSLETQLHAAATVALVAAGRRGAAAAAGAVLVAMATGAADAVTAWPARAVQWSDVFAAYASLVERPWARVTPYVLGVTAGWLVQRRDGRPTLSKWTSFWLWWSSVAVAGAAVARGWVLRRGALDTAVAAATHALWPAALLWPTVALATNCSGTSRSLFDNSVTAALSRLSYCCLLLHGPLTRALLGTAGPALPAQHALLWSYYVGVSSVTLGASLALALLVETPCCSLLRRLSDCAAN